MRKVDEGKIGRVVKIFDRNQRDLLPSQLLFANGRKLVAESIEKIQFLVTEFGNFCERKNLRVNVTKTRFCGRKRRFCTLGGS